MVSTKYSRLSRNLSKNDVLAIGYFYQSDVSESNTREKNVSIIAKSFRNILDVNFKFYFNVNTKNELEMIDPTKILDFALFVEKPPLSSSLINFSKVTEFLEAEENQVKQTKLDQTDSQKPPSPVGENQVSTNVSVISTETSPANVETKPPKQNNINELAEVFERVLAKKESQTSKLPNAHRILGVKLKYEQSRGIDSFLSLIDTFADTYDIKDPSEKVKIALLALDNSDHGLTVKQILAKEDCENWDLFRSKLQSLLGRDNDSYREEFEDWHNSDDPPTLAIAKLITIYKFSFDPPKESLTAEDEQRIIRKFIKAQDQPMRGYLIAEQNTLDLKKLGQRTQHLCRAFKDKNHPFYTVNHVSTTETLPNDFDKNHNLISKDESKSKPKRDFIAQSNPPRRPFNNFRGNNNRRYNQNSQNRYNNSNSRFNSNFRGQNRRFRRYPDRDYSKLEGFCIADLTSECTYARCRYKHK